MELRRYFAILRDRAVFIVIMVLVGLATAYGITDQTPKYAAKATIYVGTRQILVNNEPNSITGDYLTALARISATYSVMISSYSTAAEAAQRARVGRSPKKVLAEISALPQAATQLLDVKVTDRDPAVAQALVNTVVDVFIEKVQAFDPRAAPQAGEPPTLPAYVFEHARLPENPLPTDLIRRMILGGGFALVAAAGIAFLLEYLDVTIKTAADAERKLELPVLGVIPFEPDAFSEKRLVRVR